MLYLFYDNDTADLYNNLIWANTAPSAQGADLYLDNDYNRNSIPSQVILFNNDFDQSSPGGTFIQLPFPIDLSNLNNLDPLFVNPANGNYHLQARSPAIDMGNNNAPGLPGTDKDGNPRIVDGNGDGTAKVDMGAFEFGGSGAGGPPIISLALTGCTICRPGDQFTVQARVANPGPRPVTVEAKAGVRMPDGATVNIVGNKHLEVPLSAGLDTTFTLFNVPSLPDGLPTGTWTFEGTLLGPDLGETFSREVKPFEVVP